MTHGREFSSYMRSITSIPQQPVARATVHSCRQLPAGFTNVNRVLNTTAYEHMWSLTRVTSCCGSIIVNLNRDLDAEFYYRTFLFRLIIYAIKRIVFPLSFMRFNFPRLKCHKTFVQNIFRTSRTYRFFVYDAFSKLKGI